MADKQIIDIKIVCDGCKEQMTAVTSRSGDGIVVEVEPCVKCTKEFNAVTLRFNESGLQQETVELSA